MVVERVGCGEGRYIADDGHVPEDARSSCTELRGAAARQMDVGKSGIARIAADGPGHDNGVAMDEHAADTALAGVYGDERIGVRVTAICREGIGIVEQPARADTNAAARRQAHLGLGGGVAP